MIKFRVLGILALQNDNRAELDSVLSRPKLIALLSYLAIATPRGRHRRDTLLALLWPEMDEQSARHALRQALYALRRALGAGALLNRGTEEVGLVEGSVQCDAVDFEAKLDAGEATEAMELYQGDLLTAFHAPEAPEFGE